jgi:PEP-CTERM motif
LIHTGVAMISKAVAGALALAAGGLVALPVQAETIYIGFQEAGVNGGAITKKASGPATSGPFFNGSYGSFHITDALGLDTGTTSSTPDFGSSATVAAKALAAPATIWIYVEETGLTGHSAPFQVGLTGNFLSAGWTAVETAYESPGTVTPPSWPLTNSLLSHMFTGTNVAVAINGAAPGAAGPYTLTELYKITAPASTVSGHVLLTENVLTVPEPATWAMLMLGFVGLGYAAFRRSTKSRFVAGAI